MLQSAARRLTETLGIPDCDIYRLEEGDRMVCLASAFGGAYDGSWVGKQIQLADWSLDRIAVDTGRAQAASSLDDPRPLRRRTRRHDTVRTTQPAGPAARRP